MIDMDYEKKYNEALERARANYKADKEMGFLENCDMLELIFPELAESEEEERIRKVIYKLMLGMREEIFTSQDEIVTKEKVLAYLEKHKESLHISETCKENADSFTDEDERIRKAIIYYILYETKGNISEATEHVWVTWLEKQKKQKPVYNAACQNCMNDGWDNEYMLNTILSNYSLHAETLKKKGDLQGYNLEKAKENWLRKIVKPLILKEPYEHHKKLI